ncbi:MAG TPA: hypothetical protein DCW41_07585 [Clostridiales bacterium]|nr:hypothetical protein [Clostridiales bacterium]
MISYFCNYEKIPNNQVPDRVLLSDAVTRRHNMTEKELEKLYTESYRNVYFTAISLLKNKEEAEDVTQDTFITAFESYDSLKDKNKANAWIKKIAANKCLNILSRRRTFNSEDEFFENIEAVPEDFLPESLVESHEKRAILMNIIDDVLSEDLKMTVLLFYFNEMSTAEIANELGIPQGTVLSRLNYAKKKIKKGVEDYEKKNKDKLFGVGVPFLTSLFNKEAESLPIRPMSPALGKIAASKASATKAAAGAVKTAAAKGGTFAAGKVIIAVASMAAIVGGGVLLHNVLNGDNDSHSSLIVETVSENPDLSVTSEVSGVTSQEETSVGTPETSVTPAVTTPVTGPYTAYSYKTDGDQEPYLNIIRKYDENGYLVCEEYYDRSGEYMHGTPLIVYNEEGGILEIYFTDYDGNSYLMQTNDYDMVGDESEIIRMNNFNPDGSSNGYELLEYNDQGMLIRKDDYDENDTLESYWEYVYDEDGNCTSTEYTPEGTPTGSYNVRNSDGDLISDYISYGERGISGSERTRDANGNVLRIDHYHDGELTGYAEYSYNDQGMLSCYVSYNADGTESSRMDVTYEFGS